MIVNHPQIQSLPPRMNQRFEFEKFGLSMLFIGTVLYVQLLPQFVFWLIAVIAWLSVGWYLKSYRSVAWAAIALIIGYAIYSEGSSLLNHWGTSVGWSQEMVIISNRCLLIAYLVAFWIAAQLGNGKSSMYWRIGRFDETISFPWIWKGFDHPPIWLFLIVSSSITSFLFISIWSWMLKLPLYVELIGYSLLFALINAVLEEMIWRGFILSRFVEMAGLVHGLIASSLAFGLYHYSLGISLPICLAIAVGSVYMGGLTLRSKGLLPVILFHFVLNFWMFMSGMVHMNHS